MTITETPPPGMKPITDFLTPSTNRDFIAAAVRDAEAVGKQVALVRKKALVAVFTTGVRTCEEITAELSRTKTKGGVRPTGRTGRAWA